MPSSRGSIKCDGSKLVGTFDVDGSPRYITVDVKPCNRPFECNNATVTYSDITQLSGDCKWKGWVGRDDLQMNFNTGVSIVGPLDTARLSLDRTRGAGAWSTVNSTSPALSQNSGNETQGAVHAPGQPAQAEQFRQKLEKVTHVTPCVFIAEPLAAPLPVGRVSRASTRNTVKSTSPLLPAGQCNETRNRFRDAPANPFAPREVVPDLAKVERERRLMDLGVPIVVIFGQSGAGKSTFVNLIVSEQQKVGKGLHSCTREIGVIESQIGGQRVLIIDTPGIDDTRPDMKEADILAGISNHLGTMGERKVYVTGVLILHRISDNRFSQTANRVSTVLKNLCGDAAMKQLMLCTTMWDMVPEDEAYERFDELCGTGPWKEMISNGAGTAIISNKCAGAKAAAEKIVNQLIKNAEPVELAIQDEIVNQKLTVTKTSAGKTLDELRETQADAERELKEQFNAECEEETASKKKAGAEMKLKEQMEMQDPETMHLKQRFKSAVRDMQDMERKEAAVQAARAEEEILVHQREIKKQIAALAKPPSVSGFRKLLSFS